MNPLPLHWRVPDTIDELLAECECSAHTPGPYDYSHAGDFTPPSRYTRAWGLFLALVVGASIITGAYLIGRIAVWIATGVA